MFGAQIGITAARRAPEQAALVRALGGEPVLGSSLDLDVPAPVDHVAGQIRDLVAGTPDVVVAMTGIGARHVLSAADATGQGAQLRHVLERATVVARGAKARNVLRRLDVRVDLVADPPSSTGLEILARALPSDVRSAAVICAGPAEDPIVAVLRTNGVGVRTVHPYLIDPPGDPAPALELARRASDGDLAAITFTSANAVIGLVSLCERFGVADQPRPGVLVVAVGPVTRRALEEYGWTVDVEPATPRMGAMYQALAARLCGAGGGHSSTPVSRSTT